MLKNFNPLKNYVSKRSSSSDITNLLIEMKKKVLYERGIKIISPRSTSPHSRTSSPLTNSPSVTVIALINQ